MESLSPRLKRSGKKIPKRGDKEEEELPPSFELSKDDVFRAFEFFDVNASGILTMNSLKDRLSAFFPNLSSKEYRSLLESQDPSSLGKSEQESSAFTADALWEIIDTYQQQFYKPARNAASGMDPNTPKDNTHLIAVSSTFGAVKKFDPVKEAFKVYDPHGTGALDVQKLGGIMTRIGFGELSDDELAMLVKSADYDQDGKINLSDFRHLVSAMGRF